MHYIPLPLAINRTYEGKCMDCGAGFVTRCPSRKRCDACAGKRTKVVQARANQRLKARRQKQRATGL